MRAECRVTERQLEFVISGVAATHAQAVRDLGYHDVGDGEAAGNFRRTLPISDLGLHLEHVCRNFKAYAEEMVLQTARAHVTPWERALSAFLEQVAPHSLDWWIGGSAALAIRGLDVAPRDFDIIVAERDARPLGTLLQSYLVEPVTRVDWFCSSWGRAFLHARFEWVGGVDERADRPFVSDFGPTAARRLEAVSWRGYTVRLPPLDLQLEVSRRRGLANRVEQIERALNRG